MHIHGVVQLHRAGLEHVVVIHHRESAGEGAVVAERALIRR